MMVESLLPDPDSTPRCAAFARQVGLRPGGTAIRADQLLLVDLPLPWPMPVKTHPLLDGLMDVAGSASVPTRLLASVASGEQEGIVVRRFRRQGAGVQRTDYLIDDRGLEPLIVRLAAADPAAGALSIDPGPTTAVLVCTQGSHDFCCGTEGLAFFEEAQRLFSGVEFLRVSHLGGHWFAPTALTFPDGRMWAGLDVDTVGRIIGRGGDPAELARRCRGWWGADPGPAQAAEVALFGKLGWPFDAAERDVAVMVGADGSTTVQVSTGGRRLSVDVSVARQVPVIACGEPGGLPTKPTTEYEAIPR